MHFLIGFGMFVGLVWFAFGVGVARALSGAVLLAIAAFFVFAFVIVLRDSKGAERASDAECRKPEYADAARDALPRFLGLKVMDDEHRQRSRVVSKPQPVRNFNSGLFIARTACLFEVGSSQASLDTGFSEGDITVTRTGDGVIKADRIGLPDYTAESVERGLQSHCVWANLLSDARNYFASTKLGVLDAEPRTVEAVFTASTLEGNGYAGGRLVFKFRGYDGKPYWAAFDAVVRRGGCSVDFFRYYPDESKPN